MSNNIISKFVSIFTKADEVAAAEERLQLANAARIEEAKANKAKKPKAVASDGIDLDKVDDEDALLYDAAQKQAEHAKKLAEMSALEKERNDMKRKIQQKAAETQRALKSASEGYKALIVEQVELDLITASSRAQANEFLKEQLAEDTPEARAAFRAKALEEAKAKMAARLANPPVTPASEEQVEQPKKGRKKPPTPPAPTAEEALAALTAALVKDNFPTTDAQALVGATELTHLCLDKADLPILNCAKMLFNRIKWRPSLWGKLDVAAEGERRKAAKSPAGTVSGIDLTAEGDDDAPVVGATSTPLGDAKGPEKTAPGIL